MTNKSKPNVLFVGAFNTRTKDGSSGGQLFACNSLINSKLKNSFNFIKIDSTAETVPAPPVYKRLPKVAKRMGEFLFLLIFGNIKTVLIFSSAKFSFLEKGLMVLISNLVGKSVILAPRSGLVILDYEKSKIMRWYIRKVIKSATYILCQGESWRDFYFKMDNSNENKFAIIPNWIDPTQYIVNTPNYIVRDSVVKIIYIGWLEEYKGILNLLDALFYLHTKSVKFSCEIYGSGTLFLKAKYFIEENMLSSNVVLKGWANHEIKMAAFKTADIYVLPSHFEGFPNALLEAMASELPVVASNVGAVGDLVVDGMNGLLIEKNDSMDLANKLEILLKDPNKRSTLAKNGRKTVLSQFTTEFAVETFKKIL